MTEQPTPESVFEQVWRPLIDDADGAPNWNKIKCLLFDYGLLLNDTRYLYTYLTEGQITDPQHPVEDIMDISDHIIAETIDVAIRTVLNELLGQLDRTSASSAEDRLAALTATINLLYEEGISDQETTG